MIWQHRHHLLFAIFSIIQAAAAAPGSIQCAADLLYVTQCYQKPRMRVGRATEARGGGKRGEGGAACKLVVPKCGGGAIILLLFSRGDLIMPPMKHSYYTQPSPLTLAKMKKKEQD